jgi:hypothetical protein
MLHSAFRNKNANVDANIDATVSAHVNADTDANGNEDENANANADAIDMSICMSSRSCPENYRSNLHGSGVEYMCNGQYWQGSHTLSIYNANFSIDMAHATITLLRLSLFICMLLKK